MAEPERPEPERFGDPAAEVPARLRALVSPDAEPRHRAWEWLETELCHHGSASPATAHAVPFLLELLRDGGTPDRRRILGCLSRLVEPYSGGGAVLPPGPDAPGCPVRRAVAAGAGGAVVPLLDSADPSAAGAAAELLAWLPEQAPAALPGLRRLLARELPLRERTTAMIALGALAGAAGDRSGRSDLERLLDDRTDPGRWAAAVALSRVTAPGVPPAAITAMVDELSAAHLDPEAYEAVWRTRFHDGDAAGLLAAALGRLPRERRETARSAVAARLGAAGCAPEDAAAVAAGLVADALGDVDSVDPEGLTPWQWAVIGTLPGAGPVWASGELGPWLASAYGLPQTPDALRGWSR
ncbi:hypothetical protein [Streptomyces sp. CAU 1734]|uniref:hypothetical protein n=1 Tax=Streptomyces sp. CAU 1734 TaxID=3140360 RepID=UPI00326082F6